MAILPWLFGGGFSKKGKQFLMGSPEKHKRVPTLLKQQMPLAEQLWAAGMGEGAGGAFGDAADYYRSLLDDSSGAFDAFARPEMRRFNEEIVPGLAEQFAGMGSGNLSSSGFRNATVNAGTDLSERLAAIRQGLRAQGAAGLSNIGQLGLGNYSQDVMTRPGSQGFLSQAAPAIGSIVGSMVGGPVGGFIGNATGNMVGRNTSPYGQNRWG